MVAWSMRLTDKPLPKGSISHIWHPDREIEGRLSSLVPCLGQVQVVPKCISADAPGHSNMVPEAVKVMNERLGQKHPNTCRSSIMRSVGWDRWAGLMNPMSLISYGMVI